jgi:uncharacterized protein YndB with AHSA1/START domain
MAQSVLVSTVINAPVERVWQVVRDFNGLPSWMAGMKASAIEGGKDATEVGAVRRVTLDGGGGTLRERLEQLSESDLQITYSVLEGPLPVKDVVTSMRLRPITDMFWTYAEWTSQFTPEPGKEKEGKQYLTRVFNAGFRQLKRHLGV